MAEIRVSNSYKSKDEFKLNAQWLKNATRTLGSNAGSVIKDISPNIYGVVESTAQITRTLQRNKVTRNVVTRAIENNKYVKLGKTAIDNAIKDLKTGNFDNSSREAGSFGSNDSTSYHFGEMNDDAESGQIQAVVNFNPEGLNSINQSITKQTKFQMQAAKANVDAVVATSSAMMAMNQRNAEASLNMLTNINNSLQALIKYNNENMSNFISSSMTYYEMMGKIYAPKEKQKSDRLYGSDIFGTDGGLKHDKLSGLLKQNLKENYAMSMPGQVMSAINNFGDQIVANPLKIVTESLMKKAIPDAVKKATENLDKTFGNFIAEMLLKSSDTLKESTGNFAGVKRFLGNVLNINVDRRTKFKTEGKVTTDAAVFDGITRHAITAEIPKYLRESTEYLRQLVMLNGGDPDKAIANSSVFNKASGRYQRYEDFTKELMESVNNSVISSMKKSEFGKSLSRVHKSDLIGEDQKDAFEALLDKFYLALEKDDRGRIDITKRGADSDIGSIIGSLTGDENLKRILEESVYSSFKHGRGGINLNSARISAKKKRNETIESLEELNLSDLAALVKPDQNIDDAMASVIYGTDGRATNNRAYTPNSLLGRVSNIEALLDRGINVKILKGKAFKSKLSPKNSSDDESDDATPATRTSGQSTSSTQDLSAEELSQRISEVYDENQPEAKGKSSKFIVNAQNSLGNIMHHIIRGDINRVYGEMGNLFGQGLTSFGHKVNDAVLQPLQKVMFGEDENGKAISVASKVKDMFTGLKTDIADFVLGPKDESGKRESHKNSVVGFLKDGMNQWSTAIFGEDKTIDNLKEDLKKKLKEHGDSSLKGAVAGAGLGLASGGILGTLVGGPITGALLGTASSFVFKSKGFQKLVFGEDTFDEEGNPTGKKGGLISRENQKFLKDHKSDIVGSAAIGTIGGMLTGGGLLGTLVGGPLAGALLGSAVGIAKNSKTFKEFIFGKEVGEGEKKKRIGGILGAFNHAFSDVHGKKDDSVKDAAKSLASRSTVGLGGGLLLSLFTPLGPIGGAALGLAGSMVASKDKFHDLLFGKDEDKGDNKGLINRLGAQISKTVVNPLAGIAADALYDAKDAILDKVIDPIIDLTEPVAGLTRRLYDKVEEKVTDSFDKLREGFGKLASGVGGFFKNIFMKIFNRKRKDGKEKIFDTGILGSMVALPSNMLRASNQKASQNKWYDAKYRTTQDYRDKVVAMEYKWNSMSDEEKAEYGSIEEFERKSWSKNAFYNGGDTRRERREMRRARRQERIDSRQERHDAINRDALIANLTKGRYDTASKEAIEEAWNAYTKTRGYRKGRGLNGVSDEDVRRLLTWNDPNDATVNTTENLEEQLITEREQLDVMREQLTSLDKIALGLQYGFTSIKDAITGVVSGTVDSARQAIINGRDRRQERSASSSEYAQEINDYVDMMRMNDEEGIDYNAVDEEAYNSRSFADKVRDAFGYARRNKLKTLVSTPFKAAGLLGRTVFGGIGKGSRWVRGKIHAHQERMAQYRDQRNVVNRTTSQINSTNAPHYAGGTGNAKAGVAVVGENGPEVVRFGGGERVISNNDAINVRVVGVAPGVSQDVNISGQNGPIVVYPTAAKLDDKTDNKSQIEKALSKPNSLVSYNQIKADNDDIDTSGNNGNSEKEEKGLLDKLGGLGKLLLGGAGIAALLKLLSSDRVKDIIDKLGEGVGDSVSTITNVATNDGYDGGANASTNIKNQTGRWTSVVKNPLKFLFGNDGKADGQTSAFMRGGRQVAKRVFFGKQGNGAVLNALLHPVKTVKGAIKHPFTTMKNVGSSFKNIGSFIKSDDKLGLIKSAIKETDTVKQTKMVSDLFNNFKKGGGLKGAQGIVSNTIDSINPDRKGLMGMLQKLSVYGTKEATEEAVETSAKSAAKAVAKNATKESAEAIAEREARNTILRGAGKVIKEGINKAGEIIASKLKGSKAANIIKASLKFVDEGLNVITKGLSGKFKTYVTKKLSRLGSVLGLTGAVAATGVGAFGVLFKDGIFLTLGALNAAGKGGTARLFRCDQSVVDWKMRIISAAIGGFAETTFGTVFDIVNEIYCALTGDDFLTRIATALYAGIASEEDEKILSDSQKQLEVDYKKYKEDVLKNEYNAYLEDNPGSKISFEEYKKKVSSGEIKANVMGLAEYNDDRNKTFGAKIWNGTVGAVQKGWSGVKNFFKGNKTSSNTNIEGGMGSAVPFYSQKDPRWNGLPYEKGGYGDTMGTTGCGPTAFAMAASGATGKNIDPVQAASAMKRVGARDETGTNWGGIGKAASMYGINSRMERNPSTGFIDSELDAGNPVILSGRSGGYGKTPYTPQGHYVVATGRDSSGNYIINDPNALGGSRKYKKSDMIAETGAAWGFGGRGVTTERSVDPNTGMVVPKVVNKEDARAKWLSIVQAVKQAIADAHVGYYGTDINRYIPIRVGEKTISVRTDCSGFVSACLQLMGILPGGKTLTSGSFLSGDNNDLVAGGFTSRPFTGWEQLTPGDIVARTKHVEIFASMNNGSPYVYNCGSTKSCNTPGATAAGKKAHTIVWSPDGASTANAISSYETDSGGVSYTTGEDDATVTNSGSSMNFFDKITTFFSELGSRAVTGLTSGEWNTDWTGVFGDPATSTTASTSTDSASIDTSASTTGGVTNGTVTAVPNWKSSETEPMIYKYLTSKAVGLTPAGAAGLMGNLFHESGLRPTNVQDSTESRVGSDAVYTSKVDSGQHDFVNDNAGYGLAQWTTAGRKQGLLNLARQKQTSIGDINTQLEWLNHELNTSYKGVHNVLTSSNDVTEASNMVLHRFEAPKDQSAAVEQKRASAGMAIYEKYNQGGAGGGGDIPFTTSTGTFNSFTRSNVIPRSSSADPSRIGEVIHYLSEILSVLGVSSDKLNALSELKNLGGLAGNIVTNNSFYNQNATTSTSGGGQAKASKTNPYKYATAEKIARGGL